MNGVANFVKTFVLFGRRVYWVSYDRMNDVRLPRQLWRLLIFFFKIDIPVVDRRDHTEPNTEYYFFFLNQENVFSTT